MITLDQSIRIKDDTGRNPTYQITDILYSDDNIIVANLEHPDFDEVIHLMINRLTQAVICDKLPFYLAENYTDKIKNYINNGGELFTITLVDTIRDGGTITIKTNKKIEFFIEKRNKSVHSSYPPTKENEILDENLLEYLLDRFKSFLDHKSKELDLCEILYNDLKNTVKYINNLPF